MKFITSTLFTLFFLLPFFSHGQINDCQDAQVVCTSDDLAFNPIGPGLDDYADPDNDEGCITALEQNSAWYYFQIDPLAPPNLVLGFIIFPKGGLGEDYDWALYGPDVVCGDLGSPIRCSSSSAACGFCPETGMGMGTTDFTEGPGTGDGFVMTLVVQPGQGFYLMIDNWQGTDNGFVLTWTDTAADYLNCNAAPPCALEARAGLDIEICEGDDSAIPLNGESSGNNGNETYSWSGTNGGTAFLNNPNSEDPTLTIPVGFNGNITYTLTVVEDTCMSTDELEVTINPLPTVTINPVGPFCQNNPLQALTATPPGGVWGGDATGNNFNPMTNGPGIHIVTYTYTDGNGCTTMQTMDIEVYDIPDVTIDPDPAEFCEMQGSILLTATGSGGAGGYSYAWTTPSGSGPDMTYNASAAGLHRVTVTDANGCTFSTAITVLIHPTPDVEIIEPGLICESLEFMEINAVPSGGTFSGSIISPDGEIYPNTITPGTYSITYNYVDGFDCEGMDTKNITIIPTPAAFADNNGPLCAGEQILLGGQTDGTGSMISYLWDGPGGYMSNVQNPVNATLGGFYSLQVTIDNCPSAIVFTNVVVTNTPDVTAFNTGPYCNGQTVQLLGSTSATGSNVSYAWSGPNGYTSDQQNPTNATTAGIYSLIITVDQCASTIATTDVVFNAPPNASATNSGPYCAGEIISLSGSTTTPGAAINFAWTGPNSYSSSIQNPTGVLQPGLYQLTVNVDGCNSNIANTTVTVNSLPQPLISGQNSFCIGNSATIDAGAGYSSYLWNDASANQTLEVFASGTYSVTVTDGNGCSGVGSLSVTEMASLSPVITGSLEFCEGSSSVLDVGAGYTSYAWSTGESSQTISVSNEGNYGVIVTDADGCSGSVNTTIVVNPNPVVTIGGSTTYCIGGFTILDAGIGYTNYSWSNASTSQTITITTPGVYSVDVVDSKGCAGSASATISESTSLSPVITGNNAFCENGNTTLNAGSGFANYSWSDGSSSQNLVVNTAGTYSVTVSDSQGCSGDDAITITEVFPPSAVLLPGIEICNTVAGGSIVNLFDLISSGDTNGSWEDSDLSGAVGLFNNLDFTNITAGDYIFKYTTNSAIDPCPEVSYQAVVTVLDCTCPDVFFFTANPLCNAADMLDLSTLENTSEPGMWSLIQTPIGSNPASLSGTIINATGSDPGAYVLQFDLLNQPPPGCPIDFQVTLNVDPEVNAGLAAGPVSFCFNDDEIINLASIITGADINGIWTETSPILSQGTAFNPVTGIFRTNNQGEGNYTFQYSLISNGVCPDDATEVSVIINALPTVTVANIGTLDCTNSTQSLNAEGSSVGNEYEIIWTGPGIIFDGNENTLFPTIDEPGLYLLTIMNTNTGCQNSTSVSVIENTDAPTDAIITNQGPACFGDTDGFIEIDQVIGGTQPYQFSLNSGAFSSNNLYTNLVGGTYEIVLKDDNGCVWDTVIIINNPSEINVDLGPDIEVNLGDDAVVQAMVTIPANQIDTLIWTPADLVACFDLPCLEGTISTFNSVTLNVTVVDQNGCRATDDISITVNKNRRVFIPTAFSPNGDGINEVFYIFSAGNQISNIKEFVIFNRWGDLMYEAINFLPNDPTKGWDGYFKNEVMNPGVYVYRAKVEYIDGVEEIFTGDITVMK